MNLPPMSQSLLKATRDYERGLKCGLILRYEWFEGGRIESSEAMKLGQYFEYKATGALNYHGEIPRQPQTKSGAPTAEADRADQQAELFKAMLKEYKWIIHKAGDKVVNKELSLSMSRDIDIEIPNDGYWPFKTAGPSAKQYREWTPELSRVNVDLKTTKSLDSGRNPYGWGDPSEVIESDHMVQPVHYSIVTGRKGFIFMVFSLTPSMGARMYPVIVEQEAHRPHFEEIETRRNQLRSALRAGFSPHPSYDNCRNCPLAEGCAHRVKFPQSESLIYLG